MSLYFSLVIALCHSVKGVSKVKDDGDLFGTRSQAARSILLLVTGQKTVSSGDVNRNLLLLLFSIDSYNFQGIK